MKRRIYLSVNQKNELYSMYARKGGPAVRKYAAVTYGLSGDAVDAMMRRAGIKVGPTAPTYRAKHYPDCKDPRWKRAQLIGPVVI